MSNLSRRSLVTAAAVVAAVPASTAIAVPDLAPGHNPDEGLLAIGEAFERLIPHHRAALDDFEAKAGPAEEMAYKRAGIPGPSYTPEQCEAFVATLAKAHEETGANEAGEKLSALDERVDVLGKKIRDARVHTVEGLRAKVLFAAFTNEDLWDEPIRDLDWPQQGTRSLIDAAGGFVGLDLMSVLSPAHASRPPATAAMPVPADPIFAAIDAHRKAIKETNEQEDDDEADRLADIETEVMAKMLSVASTSLAGALALSRYAIELNERGYQLQFVDPRNPDGSMEWNYFVHEAIASALALHMGSHHDLPTLAYRTNQRQSA